MLIGTILVDPRAFEYAKRLYKEDYRIGKARKLLRSTYGLSHEQTDAIIEEVYGTKVRSDVDGKKN